MNQSSFVIRVYGIYIHPHLGLLVSDEFIQGKNITKFPGGGLEFGEGTIDCLKREMMEETGNEFEVISHFYTTDYFVESAFDANKQVVSIYYTMQPVTELTVSLSEKVFDFKTMEEGEQLFRFIPQNKISAEQFTLSIDRQVALLLASRNK